MADGGLRKTVAVVMLIVCACVCRCVYVCIGIGELVARVYVGGSAPGSVHP